MLFEGRASNWALTKLEIENLGIEVTMVIISFNTVNIISLLPIKNAQTCI